MQSPIMLYIFDLDNTLIDEKFYVLSKFKLLLDGEIKDNFLKQEIQDYFEQNFANKRKRIIQAINKKFETKIDVNLYKYYLRKEDLENSLKIINNSVKRLEELKLQGKEIWICTNGNPSQQLNKIIKLQNLLSFELKVLYCDNIKPKPSPKSVRRILKVSQKSRRQSIFIGDAWTDWLAARLAGIKFRRACSFFKM
jgi:FMN phosphatase YigB (HAD superfamily)